MDADLRILDLATFISSLTSTFHLSPSQLYEKEKEGGREGDSDHGP